METGKENLYIDAGASNSGFLPFSAFSLWVVLEVKRQVFVKLPWGGSLALLADIKAWLATNIINCDKKK